MLRFTLHQSKVESRKSKAVFAAALELDDLRPSTLASRGSF